MWWLKRLISRSPTYKELQGIIVKENNEKFVDARTFDGRIVSRYENLDMQPYLGELIFVREEVARRLAQVQRFLNEYSGYGLSVVYGYRHIDIQKLYFTRQRSILSRSMPGLSDDDLDEATHTFIAVPSVAGHPTGGAVDLTLTDRNGSQLDMGTRIADFDDARIITFAPGLTSRQKKNRMLLIKTMVSFGFSPFYGEWWHFSYGDREWAWWQKGRKSAVYSQVDFKRLNV